MRRRFMSNVNSFDIDNYLTFKAEGGSPPLVITFSGGDIEYCVDGDGEWITLPNGSQTPLVESGHTISFRANLNPVQNTGIGEFETVIPADLSLLGNCMSLLYGDNAASYDAVPDNAFDSLFRGLRVTSVSKNFLPATTLGYNCYSGMFYGCSRLTTAPELPATTLASGCYYGMFQDCTSLVNAPELPATTLVQDCYSYMFYRCSKLNYIKALFTTTPSSYYTFNWVNGVASSGTFVKNKNATCDVTGGTNAVPSGWTVQNA